MADSTDMMTEHIYSLYYIDNANSEQVFYIGRTQDVNLRKKQHEYSARQGTEDKYVFIRELNNKGIPWFIKAICKIDAEDYPPDYERYYVIKYARLNHQLTNMKHGDFEKSKEISRMINDKSINSIADVANYRREQEDYAKSQSLLHKIKNEQLSFEKELKLNNKILFEIRQSNLRLLSKEYSENELCSILDMSPNRISNLLSGTAKFKYNDNWARKIERKVSVEKGWLDLERATLRDDINYQKAKDKREKENKLNKELDEFKVLYNRKRRLRWHSIILNGGEYHHIPVISDVCDPQCYSLSYFESKKINLLESELLLSKGISDFDLPNKLNAKTIFNSTGYMRLSDPNELSLIEYCRKMNLLWICFRYNGLKNFAKAINKDYRLIYKYLKFKHSKPINKEISQSIENRLNLPIGSLDISRGFFFDDIKDIWPKDSSIKDKEEFLNQFKANEALAC